MAKEQCPNCRKAARALRDAGSNLHELAELLTHGAGMVEEQAAELEPRPEEEAPCSSD